MRGKSWYPMRKERDSELMTGVVVFSTPLWVFTGCLGTFACAIVVSLVMARRVFKDVELEQVEPISDEGEGDGDAR